MFKNKSRNIIIFSCVFILVFSTWGAGFSNLHAEENLEEYFTGELQAHYIDVGQGDCILIKAISEDERYKMLIDAGQEWMGRDEVVPYLESLEIETIHIAVATHPHADHIGGFIEIFDKFTVEKVIDSGYEHDTQTYQNYIDSIKQNEIRMVEGRSGMEKSLTEGLKFEIIHPYEPLTDDIHYENIVGQMRYNEIGFLFTGDLEQKGEAAILEKDYDIENEILKVGHHGSETSTTEKFLQAVEPEVSVIQVGTDNRYGHPAEKVINRLVEKDIEIYRTDYQGNIVISTDGENYEISEEPFDSDLDFTEEPEKLININTADNETLQEITGVGPAIAENIIDYREKYGSFQAIEEIKNVSGIGEARFEGMADEIKIQ